jgi:transcriptional regulator with XRE-family HTH domain
MHLRREREQRGWSREYVAEQIGVADPKTIGRWERGVACPSAYFRQKLCNFFGLSALDLGLCQEDEDELAQAAFEVVLTARKGKRAPSVPRLYDPLIPLPLAATGGLVGRDELLSRLKERLCAEKGEHCAALSGLPGVGKTALAVEFVRDPGIQQHFCDGILWASLGTGSGVPGQLRRWSALLGIVPSGTEDLTRAIRAAIGTRRMLLVIDGALSSAQVLALKVGGPNCSYLLTTRSPTLALDFAGSGAMMVHSLGLEDSLQLLARLAPDVALNEADVAQALVQAVGGLPLALTLVGRYLQLRACSG